MFNPDQQLIYFSYAFIAIMGAYLIIPILLRKRDIFTAWTIFLLGSIIFTGFSGINATKRSHYLPSYTESDYHLFFLGVVVFYGTICLVYNWFTPPRRLAGKVLLKWPPMTTLSFYVALVPFIGLIVGRYTLYWVPAVGQFIFQFSVQAQIYILTFVFVAWLRDRINPALLLSFLFFLSVILLMAASMGSGRRIIISTVMSIPIAWYWVDLRYRPAPQLYFRLGVVLLAAATVIGGHSAVRHIRKGGGGVERGVALARNLPEAIRGGGAARQITGEQGMMGQDSVECALATIHLLNDRSDRLQVKPLYSLYWMISNPVPRVLWPEKPESFGVILPRVLRLRERGVQANLGVNVVGQGYHDGGLLVLMLYALLFGSYLRFVDELLVTRPGNPFILAMFASTSGELLAWSRGAISGFSMQLVAAFVFMLLVNWVGRAILGTGIVYNYQQTYSPLPNHPLAGTRHAV